MAEYAGTRFDSDEAIAAAKWDEWFASRIATRFAVEQITRSGEGDQQVYAYSFPSLEALASLRREPHFPIKIGWTADPDVGAFSRIAHLVRDGTGLPDQPAIYHVESTWHGRSLEAAIHRRLRELGRTCSAAVGREWFLSNPA